MDKSDMYIEMYRKANPLQNRKYEKGFEEGDFVHDGEKVRIVGHDFIHLKQDRYIMQYCQPVIFAMVERESAIKFSINIDDRTEIQIKYGKYTAESIYHPIWIPRQDQLENIIRKYTHTTNEPIWKFHNEIIGYSIRNHDGKKDMTSEKIYLAYLMSKLFHVKWNVYKWE